MLGKAGSARREGGDRYLRQRFSGQIVGQRGEKTSWKTTSEVLRQVKKGRELNGRRSNRCEQETLGEGGHPHGRG